MTYAMLNAYSVSFCLLPLGALLFDILIGDPRTSFHPVALIGRMISLFEKSLLKPHASSFMKKTSGGLLVFLVLTLTYEIIWYVCTCLDKLDTWEAVVGRALLLSLAISPRSLAEAGFEIRHYLVKKNIKEARRKVGWIVGRDTGHLSAGEVTRATVETVAENIVDGVIAPLFFAALGGVPLAFLYRAVNTLDSMVGYKNEKYSDFGMIAARTDDIFNYIPARITGLLLLGAVCLLRLDIVSAVKTFWHDASKHPSPNSGIPESIVAGALHIQLGGVNYYGGIPSHRATMGQADEALTSDHIKKTVWLMYVTTLLFVLIYAGGSFYLYYSSGSF
ncbi:adenosylcobinamide-phosphate synthase [Sporomusaceae bacterium BoRhaA]|uniref:adenosylcobinamide-phosphate synthase CbiB n=1 Tax=Pelorhabdus rhamnosifermentans TaxID=2772457 RepID=UPI001FE7BB63|nr:adenosylcobinamide-phosphate synthase CbiB [Pelorhabdus rhamnosifermentans]MBU2703010.1 adenosylcobinamide-phosphate synthase [Pelorhabdus rhamnosifermentans]